MCSVSSVDKGRQAEEFACTWLKNKGFNLITRNFRKRGFEIDIIALDKNNILRFIEVKNVINGSVEDAAYSIENRNIRNYDRGVNAFLSSYTEFKDHQLSMDVFILNGERVIYYENVTCGEVF